MFIFCWKLSIFQNIHQLVLAPQFFLNTKQVAITHYNNTFDKVVNVSLSPCSTMGSPII